MSNNFEVSRKKKQGTKHNRRECRHVTISIIKVLQNDLRNATVKEITDCMKAVNNTLSSHSRMVVSGRKEEVILRFTNFIVGLISNNKRASIATVVRIVNDTAPRK